MKATAGSVRSGQVTGRIPGRVTLGGGLVLWAGLLCAVFLSIAIFPAEASQKKVLLLNSYHKGFLWSDEIVRGVEETFAGHDIDLHVEYMDTKRQFDLQYQGYLARMLEFKHSRHHYDLVITTDNNAFNFFLQAGMTLYPDCPLVFCGVNYLDPQDIEVYENLTGVNEAPDVEANIDLIRQMHPGVQKILIITDNTPSGKPVQREISRVQQRTPTSKAGPRLELVFDISISGLARKLESLGRDTVVLYTFFSRDSNGQFMEYDTAARFVAEHASVPVYGAWSFTFGSGLVGGYMVDAYKQGLTAANQALKILDGVPADQIPVVWTTPVTLMLDYRELRRHDILINQLPHDAVVKFQPQSFYYRYKTLIWGVGAGMALLFFAFLGAVYGLIKSKKAEDSMRQSRKNLQITLHSIGDAVIATDDKGKITQMNPVAESLTGWPSEDARGAELDTVFTIINARTRKPVNNPVTQVMETGHKVGMGNHTILVSQQGKEYQISDSAAPIRDDRDNLKGVVLVFRDVTEEYALYAALEKSEALYRNLFEKTNDAIFMVDKTTGCCVDANGAALSITGRTMEELKEIPIAEISPQGVDRWKAVKEEEREAMDLGMVDYLAPDQSRRTAMVSLVNLDGNTLVGFAKDITQELVMERKLRQAQKMEAMGTLAGGIAHDFNNILSGIFSYIRLVQINLERREKAEKNLEQIRLGAMRATDLVQQILTFSRQTEVKKKEFKIYLIVKEAVKFLRSSIPSSIAIKEQVFSRAEVRADPTQVHQVIMNLCTNAYHAMEKGGTLSVSLEEVCLEGLEARDLGMDAGAYVRLGVSDTGHGMDAATLEKIFDPYFTTKDPGKGTGLGLAVVDGIMKEHGGYIRAKSRPGQGTTFEAFWPVLEKNANTPRECPSRKDHDRASGHILIVDDEKEILEALSGLLGEAGYDTTAVQDPGAAWALFEKAPKTYDLLLTDMTMPGMTGFELSEKVLAVRPDMKVIICTGFHEKLTRDHARKAGISQYIEKPVLPETLYKAVKETLNP